MYGRTRQLHLAWGGRTPAAAQSSFDGAQLAEKTAATDCAELRRFLRQRGPFGATDAEIEACLRWGPNVVTARRNDLVNQGFVVQRCPYERARRKSIKTPTLKVSVWVASEFGRVG